MVIVTLIKNVGKPTFIFTDFLHFILPFTISWKTVESMVRKYKNTGTTRALPKGRPKEKSLTKEDYKERYEILKK